MSLYCFAYEQKGIARQTVRKDVSYATMSCCQESFLNMSRQVATEFYHTYNGLVVLKKRTYPKDNDMTITALRAFSYYGQS